MNGLADIRDLRVLVVGGRATGVQILRTALGIAGLRHIIVIADSKRAIETLRLQRFSAIFCDVSADPFDGMPFPLAARRACGMLNPMVPVFVVCAAAHRRSVEQARDLGVTDVLTPPISAAAIADKLWAAVNAPRPFVIAPSFVGPDRRSGRNPPYRGRDRRNRARPRARTARPDPAPGGGTPA
ncbi:MAG TPA: hypothetical protein VMU08_03025 [Rhizomicrobium sp.]|nr:hypothetical protein [Rhizomicrobium sp.]